MPVAKKVTNTDVKIKSIDTVLRNIEKSMKNTGAPVVEKAPTIADFANVPVISFGYTDVDDASFCGGIPQGKMVEIFGPESGGKSFLSLKLIASAQKSSMATCLVDAENSYDPVWADSHGVDTESLYIMRSPLAAETILEYVDKLCESGVFGLIVIDSTAALIPRAELEGSVEDQKVAELARAMSRACRKIVSNCARSNTTVVFLNQVRDKVGIMFGCFHYNARVVLADGTTEKIGKIVNNKLPVSVLSYDTKTGLIAPKKILAWHDNGNLTDEECFIQIVSESHCGNGRINIPCTTNHKIFKKVAWDADEQRYIGEEVAAQTLEVGDSILTKVPLILNDQQMQVVYGSILGDGSLRDSTKYSCHLRLGHGHEQIEYLKWKQEIMQNVVGFSDENHFDTKPLFELHKLRYNNEIGKNCNNIIPREIVDKIDVLGLAIWYLDDGGFYGSYKKWGRGKSVIYCYKFSNKQILMDAFERFGLKPSIVSIGFKFNAEETEKLHKLICNFVPPCMSYKLHPQYRDKYNYEINDCTNDDDIRYDLVPSKIIDIYEKPSTKTKKKFDLTVEDYGTYFVDGALVHNSPETTPGGKALRFYSHQRIRVTPGKKVKVKEGDKEIVIARQSWVQFVKNKAARPFGECVIEIVFDHTARNPVVKLCKAAKELKIISLRESTYRLSKDLFEDAKKNVDTEKKTNVELADYLVKNDLVKIVLEAYIEKHVEEYDDESKIDPSILAMRDDASLIVSPMEGATVEVDSELAPEITDSDMGDGDLLDEDD